MNGRAKKIYDGFRKKHNITADDKLSLLELYAGAVVNIRDAQKQLDELGLVVMDRYGVPKSNPANTILKDNKLIATKILRMLELKDEVLNESGW